MVVDKGFGMFTKKLLFSVFTFLFLMTGVFAQNSKVRFIKYDIDNKTFAVVVLVEKGLSYNDMRELAMKNGAKMALAKGYHFFVINKEDQVMVSVGKKKWPSTTDIPQNLYQEEIIEKGYNREKFIRGAQETTSPGVQNGYRFEFKGVNDSKNAHKVCDFINCY